MGFLDDIFGGSDNEGQRSDLFDEQNKLSKDAFEYNKRVNAPLVEGGQAILQKDFSPYIEGAGAASKKGLQVGQSLLDVQPALEGAGEGVRGLRETAVPAEQQAQREISLGQQYQNPYLENVAGRTLRDINESYDTRQGQLSSKQAGEGNFGSTRSGVENALLQREKGRSIGDTLGNLYHSSYEGGLDRGTRGLAREQSQLQGLTGLSNLASSQATSGLNLSSGATQLGNSAPFGPLAQYAAINNGNQIQAPQLSIPGYQNTPGALGTGLNYLTGLGKAGAFGNNSGGKGWLTGGGGLFG